MTAKCLKLKYPDAVSQLAYTSLSPFCHILPLCPSPASSKSGPTITFRLISHPIWESQLILERG